MGKCFPSDPEDHIADGKRPACGRAFVHFRDGDLAGIRGHHLVGEHPAARAGRAEVPVLVRAGRDGIALGEIRILHLPLRSGGAERGGEKHG